MGAGNGRGMRRAVVWDRSVAAVESIVPFVAFSRRWKKSGK